MSCPPFSSRPGRTRSRSPTCSSSRSCSCWSAEPMTRRASCSATPGTTAGCYLTSSLLVSFLFLLVSGTNDSAGKLLGNAWYHGWLLPDVQRAGLNGRAADWMEEFLRYDTPSQMTARTLTEDIELHGTRVPAGARVALLPASANRDRRVFRDPDRFDLNRDTSQSISFGHGPHFCLGAALARLEMRIALDEIGAVVSGYEIDMDGAVRVHSPHQRGFAVLPCSVTLRNRRPAERIGA